MTPLHWLYSLLAHAWGDYILQSDWQANHKTKSSWAALVHALLYSCAFVPLVWDAPRAVLALAIIASSHFIIDRWRLARFLCYAKNYLAPPHAWPKSWAECSATGYDPERPAWLTVWLLIITDNTLHVSINTATLWWAHR